MEKIKKHRNLFYILAVMQLFVIAGCIDTDFINDPVVQKGRVEITQKNPAVMINGTIQLNASLKNADGSNASGIVMWVTSDNQIAEVDGNGVCTGNKKGQVFLTAKADGFESDSVLLTVVENAQQIASITITPASSQLKPNETVQLTAQAKNINGDVINGVQFTWNSSNNSAANVSSNGLVTAGSSGTANITASSSGVTSNSAQITVTSNSRSGNFVKHPGQSHNVSGTATLTQQPNGSLLLTFGNNFSSSGGPDVRVFLSTTNGLNSSSVDLGGLKSTSGAQSYSVPSSVRINDFSWVVIHCVPFNITFGYANLK